MVINITELLIVVLVVIIIIIRINTVKIRLELYISQLSWPLIPV